jgi:uncharacterized protein HemY
MRLARFLVLARAAFVVESCCCLRLAAMAFHLLNTSAAYLKIDFTRFIFILVILIAAWFVFMKSLRRMESARW